MTNWTTFCRKMWKPGKLQMCKKTKNAMDKDFASTFDCIECNFCADFKSCLSIENRVHSTWNPLSDVGGTWQLFLTVATINRYRRSYFQKAQNILSTKFESFLIFFCHRLVTCSASHFIKRVKRLIGFVRGRGKTGIFSCF